MNKFKNTHSLKGSKCSLFHIVACSVLLLTSCRMSKELHKKDITTAEKTTNSVTAVDTSKTTTVTEAATTEHYGDTLTGNLYFDDSAYLITAPANDYFTDSIESNGVKVSVSLVKTKTGIKARVKAIAKPAAVTDYTRVAITDFKGVAVKATATVEKKNIVVTKDLKTTSFPIGIVILLIIAAFAAWFLTKYKNFI